MNLLPRTPTLAALGSTFVLLGLVACGGASSKAADSASSKSADGATSSSGAPAPDAEAAPSDWPTGKMAFDLYKTKEIIGDPQTGDTMTWQFTDQGSKSHVIFMSYVFDPP